MNDMDMEKVKYDIERCVCHVPDACRDCSHYKHGEYLDCMEELLKDALGLLKERTEETKFVYDEYITPMCEKCGFHPFCGYIPTIKWMEERGYKKCPSCGRTIKWN